MADTLNFELVSPEKLVFSGAIKSVVVPGREGDFEVLPQHSPMLASLRPGIVSAQLADGGTRKVFVRGGLADVGPEGVTILAQQLADLESGDTALRDREISAAEELLKTASNDEQRFEANTALATLRA